MIFDGMLGRETEVGVFGTGLLLLLSKYVDLEDVIVCLVYL